MKRKAKACVICGRCCPCVHNQPLEPSGVVATVCSGCATKKPCPFCLRASEEHRAKAKLLEDE